MKGLIMKKRILSIILAVLLIFPAFAGCSAAKDQKVNLQNGGNKLVVVATIFPQFDFARIIGGDFVSVQMLLPPGTESHSFDPRPSDVLSISNADLFIYTGDAMEPWAGKILSGVSADTLHVLDASKGIQLIQTEHHEQEQGESEEEHEYDPHIWLDLTNAMVMVDNITDSFCEIDPAHAEIFRQNAEDYKKELQRLDEDILQVVSTAKRKEIVFGGRFAYGYFVKRYGLSYISAYDTCSSEGEPSVQRIAEIIDFVKQHQIPAVYHEELVEPKVARSIAEQTGAELLLFSTGHSVTKDELEKGVSYLDIMRSNLENLTKGLN